MATKWYRADFSPKDGNIAVDLESDYFECESDTRAIEVARETADRGFDFADIGHVEAELTQVFIVDDTQETFPEVKQIYW